MHASHASIKRLAIAVCVCAAFALAACAAPSESETEASADTVWGSPLNGPVIKLSSVADGGVIAAGGSQVVMFGESGEIVWEYERDDAEVVDFWSDGAGKVALVNYRTTGAESVVGLDCVVGGKVAWSRVSEQDDVAPLGRISADGKTALVVLVPLNKLDGVMDLSLVNTADGSTIWTNSFDAANGLFAASPGLTRVLAIAIPGPSDQPDASVGQTIGIQDGVVSFVLEAEEQAPFPVFLDENRLLLGAGEGVSLYEWDDVAADKPVWQQPVEWASDIIPTEAGIAVMTYSSDEDRTFTTACMLLSQAGSVIGETTLKGKAAYTLLVAPSADWFLAVPQNVEVGGPTLTGKLDQDGTRHFADKVHSALLIDEGILVGLSDGSLRVMPSSADAEAE